MLNLALRVREAVIGAGVAISDVSIGDEGNKATWLMFPANLQSAAQPTIDAFDTSQAAEDDWLNLSARSYGQVSIDDDRTALYKVLRAEASVLVEEINALRQWIAAFKVQVAAATTLADLKTRVASLPNMPDRTLEQAKTAIKNTIAAGTVD